MGLAPLPLMVMPLPPGAATELPVTGRSRAFHTAQGTEGQQPNEHPAVCRRHRQSQAEGRFCDSEVGNHCSQTTWGFLI